MQRVVIIGPAYPLRGGLATFNERLAREFQQQGYDTVIYTFTLQYPSFLFPGTTQYASGPPPKGLSIVRKINSVNPWSWISTGLELKKKAPDLLIVRYWLPFMGPALGTVLRIVKRNRHTRIIAITDNVIPHEKRPGDLLFTKYFLGACDAFVTMSEKVMQDLRTLEPRKPAWQAMHPLYDNFGEAVDKKSARDHLGLEENDLLLLFFGFIRKYKGLDLLLEAVRILKEQNADPGLKHVKLIVAGEFYEDDKPYLKQISDAGIRANLVLHTGYIPDEAVKYYFCAADVVVQPYRNATQSGVTPLAYHFEKPMIVTNVGALEKYVPDGKSGLVAEPNPQSIAETIKRYFELGEAYFIPHLRVEKLKFSWTGFVKGIVGV